MENLMVFVPQQLGILVAALYVIGVFLKRTPEKYMPDWCIPWVLVILGILGSIGIEVIDQTFSSALLTTSILQGLCAAGVAVLGNQVYKQITKATTREDDFTVDNEKRK